MNHQNLFNALHELYNFTATEDEMMSLIDAYKKDLKEQGVVPTYQYKAICRGFDREIIFYFDDEKERLNFGQVELKVMDVCPTALLRAIKEREVTELSEEIYPEPKNLDTVFINRTDEEKAKNRTAYNETPDE